MVLKSKRQAVVKDRISALPDALVCHILSFLRTKYAVRTGILSTRWKDMWTCVPNIDFDNGEDSALERKDAMARTFRFMTFVDHVLFFRGSTEIQKFQLRMCSSFEFPRLRDLSRVDGWIRTAIKRNLVELDLTLYFKSSDELRPKKIFMFPKSLFTCKTLQVLKVWSNCIAYNPPTSGCFPCLKFLDATLIYPDNNDFKLFPHCPLLESLTIQGIFYNDRVLNFNVSAPKLRKLKVSLMLEYSEGDGYNFYIDAPKLENFNLILDRWPSYYLESVKSLVQAKVRISETDVNRVAAFLTLISHVKYLSLELDFEYLGVILTFLLFLY